MLRLIVAVFTLLTLAVPVLAEPAAPKVLKPAVVASNRPLAGILFDLAGDLVQLRLLQAEDGDIHTAALKPSQLEWLDKADMIVLSGLGLDLALEKAIEAHRPRAVQVVAGRAPQMLLLPRRKPGVTGETEEAPGAPKDPHWWLSAMNQAAVADYLTGELIELMPYHAGVLQERLMLFNRDLLKLDTQWQGAFTPYAAVPYVSLHDAWQYIGRRFGLKEIAVAGSEAADPLSPRRLEDVRKHMLAEAPVCLVADASSPPATVEALFNAAPAVLTHLDEDGRRLAFGSGFSLKLLQENYGKLYDCLKAVDEGRKAD